MPDTPWTPGPWDYENGRIYPTTVGFGAIVAAAKGDNGRLIALAPEMAEAILGYDEMTITGENVDDLMFMLANKLRAIGATE